MRRFLVRTVVIGALLAGAVYGFRARLIAPYAISAAGDALGGTLSVETVEGNWFTTLTLSGVRFEADDETTSQAPLTRIEHGRIEAEYSPWRLLRDGLDGLERLDVSARVLELDLRASEAAADDERAEAGTARAPERLPRVRLALGTARLRLANDQELTVEDLTVDTERSGDVRVGVTELDWKRPGAEPVRTSLELNATYAGGEIVVESFTAAPDVAVESLRVDLDALVDEGRLLDARARILEGVVVLGVARTEAGWSGDVRVEGFDLATLARLFPERTGTGLAGSVDLNGTFDVDTAGTHARLDVTTTNLTDGRLLVERGEASLRVDPKLVALDRLLIESRGNRISSASIQIALDPLRSATTPKLGDVLRAASGQVAVELTDALALVPGAEASATLGTGGNFEATLTDGVLDVRAASMSGSAGTLSGGHGRLVLGPATDPWGGATIAVDYDLEIPDLHGVGILLGRDDWSGSLQGSLVLSGPLLAPEGALKGDVRDLFVGGWRLDEASVSVRTDGNRVQLEQLEGRSASSNVTLSGAWERAANRIEDVALVVDSDDLGAIHQLDSFPGLSGNLRLEVHASGRTAAPVGDFRLTGTQLFGRPKSTVDASGSFAGGRFVLEQARVSDGDDYVDAVAALERGDDGALAIELQRVDARRAGRPLTLVEPTTLSISKDGVSLPGIAFSDATGSAFVELHSDERETSGRVSLHDFDPTPLLFPWLPPGWNTDVVDATLTFARTDETTRGTLHFRADRMRPGAEAPAWRFALAASLEDGRLVVPRCEAVQTRLGAFRVSGAAPLAPFGDRVLSDGPVELKIALDARKLEEWQSWWPGARWLVDGFLHVEGQLEGDWSALNGHLYARGDALSLRANPRWSPEEFQPEHLRARELFANGMLSLDVSVGESVRVEAGSLRLSDVGSLELTGELGSPIQPSALVRGELDRVLDARLEADATVDVPDASALQGFTPSVRRMEGSVAGGIALRGSLRAPELRGDVELRDAGVRFAASFPPIEELEGSLSFEGTRLDVRSLSGELGAGPFEVTGTLDFPGGQPSLDLSATGTNVLLARMSRMRVRADIDLSVSGPLDALHTSGDVVLTDGYFGRDYDLFGFLSSDSKPSAGRGGFAPTLWRQPPLADMQLGIDVTSREPFVVRNNLVNGAARPELLIRGTGEVPLVIGSVYLDPTRVSLPAGTLSVESGLIEFTEANPFMPRLQLTGAMRLSGYEIEVDITGPYIQPEIALSSTPPLSEDQLLLLFLTGDLPNVTATDRSTQAAQSIATFLARDFLTRRFAGGSEGGLADRFELEWGTEISRNGSPTARLTLLLDDRPRGPGHAPFLSAERDRYDKINFGIGVLFRFR